MPFPSPTLFPAPTVFPEDVSAPETTIPSGAPAASDTSPTFLLAASEEGCGFEVRLDAGAWELASGTPEDLEGLSTCVHELHGLYSGPHTLEARAVDLASNTDGTPASVVWNTNVRIAITQEFPPDELAMRVTPPGGSPSRWAADEALAENIIDGLECSDEIPGGEKDARGNLARDPRTPWPDLVPFSDVEIYGPGGETVWQGRFGKDSRVEGDSTSIAVEMEGHSTELEDNKALKLGFVDRDLSRWGGASGPLKLLLGSSWDQSASPSQVPDAWGMPSLRLSSRGLISHPVWPAVYDSGGPPVGQWVISPQRINLGTHAEDPFVAAELWVSPSDDSLGVQVLADASPTDTYVASGGNCRYLYFWSYYNATGGGGEGVEYGWLLSNLIALGSQGLAPQGTFPDIGFTARQMLEWAVENLTSLEFDEESEDDGYVITQAWWPEFTTLAAVIQELTRYGLLDWTVFGKKFSLRTPGSYGRKWKLCSGSSEFQEDGVDGARSWWRISVAWPDPGGKTRTAGPLGSGADYETSALEITDPDHPAVRADKDRHDVLVLKGGNPSLAIATGERWLVEANELSHAGSCSVSGFVQNEKGIWFPASAIRGGDHVSRADSGDPSYRKITSRVYAHNDRRASLALDAPPEGLQALLERYEADLISLGAS